MQNEKENVPGFVHRKSALFFLKILSWLESSAKLYCRSTCEVAVLVKKKKSSDVRDWFVQLNEVIILPVSRECLINSVTVVSGTRHAHESNRPESSLFRKRFLPLYFFFCSPYYLSLFSLFNQLTAYSLVFFLFFILLKPLFVFILILRFFFFCLKILCLK